MSQTNIADLYIDSEDWNITTRVARIWEATNRRSDRLIALEMILLDEQVIIHDSF